MPLMCQQCSVEEARFGVMTYGGESVTTDLCAACMAEWSAVTAATFYGPKMPEMVKALQDAGIGVDPAAKPKGKPRARRKAPEGPQAAQEAPEGPQAGGGGYQADPAFDREYADQEGWDASEAQALREADEALARIREDAGG